MRYYSRLDVLKGILLNLANERMTEWGIAHSQNLSESTTKENLALLKSGGVVTVDESAFYHITQKGRALLQNWEEVDRRISTGYTNRGGSNARKLESSG